MPISLLTQDEHDCSSTVDTGNNKRGLVCRLRVYSINKTTSSCQKQYPSLNESLIETQTITRAKIHSLHARDRACMVLDHIVSVGEYHSEESFIGAIPRAV